MEILEQNVDGIWQLIESGLTQNEIAAVIGIDRNRLSHFVNRDEYAARLARARESSAEAWLDRGLEAVQRSLGRNSEYDPTAARNYAMECARRAAIRNPKYREKQQVEVSGSKDNPLTILVAEMSSRLPVAPRVIEHEAPPALPAAADDAEVSPAPPRLT